MMTLAARLQVVLIMLALSVVYGTLVLSNTELARTLVAGYIAIILTGFGLVHFWRKP